MKQEYDLTKVEDLLANSNRKLAFLISKMNGKNVTVKRNPGLKRQLKAA